MEGQWQKRSDAPLAYDGEVTASGAALPGLATPPPGSGEFAEHWPIGLSVRAKIAIGLVAVFVLSIGAGAFFLLWSQGEQLKRRHRERADLIASSIRSGVTRAMVLGEPEELATLLLAYGAHNSDNTAEILSSDMRVVASSLPHQIGQQRTLSADVPVQAPYFVDTMRHGEDDEPATTRIEVLRNRGVCRECHRPEQDPIGYLTVSLSQSALEAERAELGSALLKNALLTLLLLVVISWFAISRLVVDPVRGLVDTIRLAQGGNLTVRAEGGGGDDEFSWLAASFNRMLEALGRARRKADDAYRNRLAHADRFATVGELASGLAHEIKNPLAGLSGAMQILAEDFKDDPERTAVAAEMQRQIARLDSAVNGLLRFARPQPPTLARLAVREIIERVLLLVSKQRTAAKVEFVTEFRTDASCYGDAALLEQVFLNLCLNALQAMPDGGTLRVCTCDGDANSAIANEDELFVEFTDSGIGITEEVGAAMFKPFFTTKTTGTGLGLAISARIIEEHEGDLDFRSEPGKGTTFIVRLPKAPNSG